MLRLIWVVVGRTWNFVGFVMLRLKHKVSKWLRCCLMAQLTILWSCLRHLPRHWNNYNSAHLSTVTCYKHRRSVLYQKQIEPPLDKTNKMSVCPAKTQISLGIRTVGSESSLCAKWVAKDWSFLHADSEDSDQTGRMPRLVFAGPTCHFVGFIVRRLNLGGGPVTGTDRCPVPWHWPTTPDVEMFSFNICVFISRNERRFGRKWSAWRSHKSKKIYIRFSFVSIQILCQVHSETNVC